MAVQLARLALLAAVPLQAALAEPLALAGLAVRVEVALRLDTVAEASS